MKLKLILLFLFLGINFAFYLISEKNKNERIDKTLELQLERLQSSYNHNLYEQKSRIENLMSSIEILGMDILSKLPNASEDQLDSLRNELYQRLINRYAQMQKVGIFQFHFVLPNNRSFLRVHRQEHYGDDLTGIRKGYEIVNKTQKPLEGFESGKMDHGYRYIMPIFDDNGNYLCLVDISFSTVFIQEYLTNVSQIHSHLLVHKDTFSHLVWERDEIKQQYIKSAEHKDYRLMLTNQHTVAKCIVQNSKNLQKIRNDINKGMNRQKPFSLYTKKADGQTQMISFLPIKSIENQNLAWIVSYGDDGFISSTLKLIYGMRIAIFTILSILFYFIYTSLKQRQKLEELNSNLESIVEEKTQDIQQALDEKEQLNKELQEINETLDNKVKDEVEKNRLKDIQLLEQEKMVSMGEMIGNIAHQWRQPLSVITASASGIQVQKEFGILDDELLNEELESIKDSAQYLSQTIDTFRDFLKENKSCEEVVLQDTIDLALNIVHASLKSNNIELINQMDYNDPISIELIAGEFSQVLINIFNNAKDVLLEKNISNAWISLQLEKHSDFVLITIEDNAGGIPENIIQKIFDAYFTTKHQSRGTGLGLHMSYKIITESLKGKLYVKNTENGAKFFIELPLK